jgi:hypothetical protein
MLNPDTAPASAYMPSLETAARSLKVQPFIAPVHSDEEIETAIIAVGREPGGGYVVRDGNGQALVYVYSRDNDAEALQAKRGAPHRRQCGAVA